MNTTQILFWFLSGLAVFSSIMVITRKNPVFSVLYLIITFFAISGHYFLMNAQFLAIVNIIVYAGAIMVLFLFVLMLMNLNKESEPQKNKYLLWSSAIAGGMLMIVFIAALHTSEAPKINNIKQGEIGQITTLGNALFSKYYVPFEISSILLISAMVGAMVIGKKDD
ncbi:MAG TPA: NADH-quinone oxidoreductase subunit J [Phnomibacter sp.]|nr:NADH-quinone oxidoreductase subunit J [Phnomibacter sp.]